MMVTRYRPRETDPTPEEIAERAAVIRSGWGTGKPPVWDRRPEPGCIGLGVAMFRQVQTDVVSVGPFLERLEASYAEAVDAVRVFRRRVQEARAAFRAAASAERWASAPADLAGGVSIEVLAEAFGRPVHVLRRQVAGQIPGPMARWLLDEPGSRCPLCGVEEEMVSSFTGVRHRADRARRHEKHCWEARIWAHGKWVHLMYCTLATEAARVVDVARALLYGRGEAMNFDGRPPAGVTEDDVREILVRRGVLRE